METIDDSKETTVGSIGTTTDSKETTGGSPGATTDELLDGLLMESVRRHDTVARINTNVMRAVRRDSRKVRLRRVVRILALCIGVPLLLFLPAMALRFVPLLNFRGSVVIIAFSMLCFYVPVVLRLNDVFKRAVV